MRSVSGASRPCDEGIGPPVRVLQPQGEDTGVPLAKVDVRVARVDAEGRGST